MPGQNFRGFAERVALVVGGAHGVGRAVALQLAFEGVYVIVNYRAEDSEAKSVLEELREMGTLAHAFPADVSRASEVAGLFDSVNDAFGRLDLVVNVAQQSEEPIALEDLTGELWDERFNRDLKSTLLCTQAAVPFLRKRPSPAIVNISAAGQKSGVHAVAAQAAISGLTKALARELAPRIRVNGVAVGETSRGRTHLDNVQHASGEAASFSVPADETARAAVYLLSPAARFITGQILTIGN
jgi:3-oxoacyl-[acyl-carrier protein] reductase